MGNGDGRVVDKARILKAFSFQSYLHPYNFFRVFIILLHSSSFDNNSEDAEGSEWSLPFYRWGDITDTGEFVPVNECLVSDRYKVRSLGS